MIGQQADSGYEAPDGPFLGGGRFEPQRRRVILILSLRLSVSAVTVKF